MYHLYLSLGLSLTIKLGLAQILEENEGVFHISKEERETSY
jgi:hypothetical protein